MPYLVCIGSSGLLGRSVCNAARMDGYTVIGLGRSINENCDRSIIVDFSDLKALIQAFKTCLEFHSDISVVFCHRSRIAFNGTDAVVELMSSLQVDLSPYLALKQVLHESQRNYKLNIVSITSNSAYRFACDVDYYYHIEKRAQIAAALGLAFLNTRCKVLSNIVSFGEVVDSTRTSHDYYHELLFANLAEIVPTGSIPTTDDVATVAIKLLEISKSGLNGQVICVDNGLHMQTQESIGRLMSKKEVTNQ